MANNNQFPPVFADEHVALIRRPRVLLDSSIIRAIGDNGGVEQFLEDLDHVLPVPGAELVTTNCIQQAVASTHGNQFLIAVMGHFTCLHKDEAPEEECIDLVLGSTNPSNVVLGTQNLGNHMQTARLPVLRYNNNGALLYRAPSARQLMFAQQVEADRIEQIDEEKRSYKNQVKRFKRIRRGV